MYTSPSHIAPYLEPPRIGPTALFCRELAKRTRAYVASGYPEAPPEGSPDGERGWNSLVLVDPQGEIVHNYRKRSVGSVDRSSDCLSVEERTDLDRLCCLSVWSIASCSRRTRTGLVKVLSASLLPLPSLPFPSSLPTTNPQY
jgi:predicted amidohydrolase